MWLFTTIGFFSVVRKDGELGSISVLSIPSPVHPHA